MVLVIDIILVIILATCTWNGFKRGFIGGIAGLLTIIIAVYGGALLSSAFTKDVIPAFESLVDGYIDSSATNEYVLERMGRENTDLSLADILNEDATLNYDYAFYSMEYAGLSESMAHKLASDAVTLAQENNGSITAAVVRVLCETIIYVIGTAIGFFLILIAMFAVANLFNVSLKLPNMQPVDDIGGLLLGAGNAIFYCVLLSWFLSFFGLLIGKETMNNTLLGSFFSSFTFITDSLM